MTIFNVHIYREMRLVFGGIEADNDEAAAAIARCKPSDWADDIAECDGDSFYACVDVEGDEEYEQSRWIDFEPERERQAAPKLLAALEGALEFLEANDDGEPDVTSRIVASRHAIAAAKDAGITPEPRAPGLLAALQAVLAYAENERASLSECWKRDDDPTVKEELDACDCALDQANAAIAQAKAASEPSPTSSATAEMRDALNYVAEMLSSFKPDLLRNFGLDVALEKSLAALGAAENAKAQEGRHE